jgi:hypothetical protein
MTLINYKDTLVHCRFSLFLNHKVRDCVELKLNQHSLEVIRMLPTAKGREAGRLSPTRGLGTKAKLLSVVLTPIRAADSN